MYITVYRCFIRQKQIFQNRMVRSRNKKDVSILQFTSLYYFHYNKICGGDGRNDMYTFPVLYPSPTAPRSLSS